MIKKIRLFLIFLGLSLLVWFFSAMSSVFSFDTTVKLAYQNDVKRYFLQEKPLEKVKVKVKTNGFKHFYLFFFPKTIRLQMSDFNNAEHFKYYFLPNQHLTTLQKQWNQPQIINFEKDTLWLSLGELQHKKIPIVSQIKVETKSGFLVKDKLKIIPDSITVIGPEKMLRLIRLINTEKMHLTDIQSDINQNVLLNSTEANAHKKLFFSDTIVKVTGTVSKFTEVKMDLPILINSKNNSRKIEIFPSRATLYYLVSFEDYDKVHPYEFELVAKVSDTVTDRQQLAVLSVSKKPEFVKISRIEPDYVNYLIQHEKN